MDHLSPEDQQQFIALQKEGKSFAARGFLKDSLHAFKKAALICKTEKILSRIDRLEKLLESIENEDDGEDEMVELGAGFKLYHEIYKSLYPYQRAGVKWMWKLYSSRKGGVLGDDMGLGKTFQVIAFLSGMIDAGLIKHVLIVMPVSLIANWNREFQKWCPGIKIYDFHGTSKKDREQKLNRAQRREGVVLTSYGMILNNIDIISKLDGRDFIWDYFILDEGHKIKNPSKTTKAVHEIPSKQRLVLTGTPIQNNLKELWALYDFAHHGTLLGTQKTFKLQYETPILRSLEKDSSLGERRLGSQIAENLKLLIKPYFLRRTKAEVLENKDSQAVDELGNKLGGLRLNARKNDLILWAFLSKTQYDLYTSFLASDAVKSILVATRSPLVELTILKKICDHPRLLSHKACLQLGLNGKINEEELNEIISDESTNASSIQNVSDETLIHESGKLKLTIDLLENLKENGHRTLVFSLSRKILDMIHRILSNRGWKVMRIDGTITKMQERDRRIQLFQNNASYPVFLLTTQVGGVGITLTAADRVIIYDPSWNPATDAQAVDRVFRIGQKSNVVVYRLITCATVEEKIYRRQIFKDSITRQATGANNEDPHRYFSKQQLRELFTIGDIYSCETQQQLEELHSSERKTDMALDEHIKYLHTLEIFGISDHDLMFTKDIQDEKEDDDPKSLSHEYIKKRVEMAQQLVQTEASVVAESLKVTGSFVKKFDLPIPASIKKNSADGYQQPNFPEIIDLEAENGPSSPLSNKKQKSLMHVSGDHDDNDNDAKKQDENEGEFFKDSEVFKSALEVQESVDHSSFREKSGDYNKQAEVFIESEDNETNKGNEQSFNNSNINASVLKEVNVSVSHNASLRKQTGKTTDIVEPERDEHSDNDYGEEYYSSRDSYPYNKLSRELPSQVGTLVTSSPIISKEQSSEHFKILTPKAVGSEESINSVKTSTITESSGLFSDSIAKMKYGNLIRPSFMEPRISTQSFSSLDISDDERPVPKSEGRRKSCAVRPSIIEISESETSQTTCSSLNASAELLVPESDEELIESDDGESFSERISKSKLKHSQMESDDDMPVSVAEENNDGLPVSVAEENNDGLPVSVAEENNDSGSTSFEESPQLSESRISMKVLPLQLLNSSDATRRTFIPPEVYSPLERRDINSPKRLTPLKILEPEVNLPKSPFQGALDQSVELPAFPSSNLAKSSSFVQQNSPMVDSPIPVHSRKNPKRIIDSDSDDDEDHDDKENKTSDSIELSSVLDDEDHDKENKTSDSVELSSVFEDDLVEQDSESSSSEDENISKQNLTNESVELNTTDSDESYGYSEESDE